MIQVEISLKNTGTSLLQVKKSIHRIQQINPMLECVDGYACAINEINNSLSTQQQSIDRFSWPMLNEISKRWSSVLDIEPNEMEVLDFEFVVSSDVNTIRLYNYFRNEHQSTATSEMGWSATSLYEIKEKE